jgi:imidazolonepropionase-like amidohydrolase
MVSSLPLWIRSHHVWNERAGRFEARALRIEGDRITAVAAHSEVPDGAALRDFGDAYVMPGLLNTHVHLDFSGSQTPLKDFESEDPAERLLRAAGNAHRLLMSGCTTARDCGSHWTTLALARRPDLSPVPLPRLLLSGPPITVPRGHLHFMHGVVRDDGDIVAHIDRLQREGGTSVKCMVSGGQMTPGSKPEETVFEQPSLDLMTAESRRRSLPSVAHVLSTESVRRAALARFDSLEHCAFFERLPNGLINRNYDEQVALVVRDSGVAMMANLSTAMPSLDRLRTLPERSDVQDNALRQFDKMIDNFGKLVRLGVPMVCGNDAGVNETSFDSTWYEVAWMIKAGQSPVEALRSATIGAARALLIDNHVGRLEKDYSADIIALAGDPLDDAAHLQAPGFVMARGEIHVDAPAGRPA